MIAEAGPRLAQGEDGLCPSFVGAGQKCRKKQFGEEAACYPECVDCHGPPLILPLELPACVAALSAADLTAAKFKFIDTDDEKEERSKARQSPRRHKAPK